MQARITLTLGGVDSGTSTGTGATSLTDTLASWTVNAYAGLTCFANGKTGVISSNTATILTVASWTGGTPGATSTYIIGAVGTVGSVGAVPLFTTTGLVLVRAIAAKVNTTLVGASATLALGVTGSTGLFIPATVATTLTTTASLWASTVANSTGLALPAVAKDILVVANIIGTIAVADITAGALEIVVFYDPVTNGAILS